jgi:2-(3-amino-3-carboxypropyl)histidine synthase
MSLTENYDLDLPGIVAKIKAEKAKRVLVQLPDGLKPAAEELQAAIRKELPGIELFFWAGSAFGSCDIPLHVDRLGFDLLIHLGHAPWR